MTMKRLHYAIKAPGIKPDGNTGDYTVVHGVQSVSLNTTFNLEQVFELGQLEIYENIEDIPDIEVTAEKVLDGYPLIYHLATQGAATDTLAGRSNQRCIMALSIFDDDQDSASGTPLMTVEMSGLYVSALSYTFPVEGNCSESVTMVGNNKVWSNGGTSIYGNAFDGTLFDNTDEPLALANSGGVQRRENVLFGADQSRLPTQIPGLTASGFNIQTAGDFAVHVQNITISTDLGRTELNELGRKGPYHRYVDFPTEVTSEFEIIATSGDFINALENQDNLVDETIVIKMEEGLQINCGSRNKLQSVSMSGADAGGGNETITYTYSGFNNMTVSHPQSP